jgi:flagella basal body P-ring formation protein FlgA
MIARRGGVSITSIGEALGNGSRGAMIRVRNVQSRKIVGGKIISPGVVEMEF